MQPTENPATPQIGEGTLRLLACSLLLFLAAFLLAGCTTPAGPPGRTPAAPPDGTAADASGAYLVEYIGRVTDAATRRGIAGAKVVLEFAGAPPIVYTDDEGVFRFQVRSERPVLSGRVRVEAQGYGVYDRNVDVSPAAPRLEDIRLAPEVAALPTPTPAPTPVDADILITEFDSRHATRSLEIGRRLEQDLERQLRTYELNNVVIKVIDQVVGNDEQATDLARSTGSRAVIWGWYDDLGVSVRILLADPDVQVQDVPGIDDLPLTLGGDPAAELAFVIRQVLPANISFLSLFVIGHLYYTNNEYGKGRAAFDAAMANLPQNVAFENQAILHFFRARQMEAGGSEDHNAIICEYIAAIEQDPTMAAAYNNLGVFLHQHLPKLQWSNTSDLVAGRDCVERAGIDIGTLFSQAQALRPKWIVPQYNQMAVKWDTQIGTADLEQYKGEIESLLAADPTLSGAYIILGLLEAAEGNLSAAEESLSAGLARIPKGQAGSVHAALGLVYLGQAEYAKAASHFREALALNPQDQDARLGLAAAEYYAGNTAEALDQLDAMAPDSSSDADEMGEILRSRAAFDAGDYAQAAGLLRQWVEQHSYDDFIGSAAFVYYLAGLMELALGDPVAAQGHFTHPILVAQLQTADAEPSAEPSASAPALTRSWFSLAKRCAASWQAVDASDLQATLVNDPCLPVDLDARITALYDIWQAALARRFFEVEVTLGQACPFVFTYDEDLAAWQFDTTILYMLVGPQSEQMQARPLARFDGRLLVREMEPETSYLDFLAVVAMGADGEVTVWLPTRQELGADDGTYIVLEQGDELLVQLAPGGTLPPLLNHIPRGETGQDGDDTRWWVIGDGYYIPYRADADQRGSEGGAP